YEQMVTDEFHGQTEANIAENGRCGLLNGRADIEGNVIDDTSWQGAAVHLEGGPGQVSESELRDVQQLANIASVETRVATGEDINGNWREDINNELSAEAMGNEAEENVPLVSTREIFSQQHEASREETTIPLLSIHLSNLEAIANEDVNWHESPVPTEQLQS